MSFLSEVPLGDKFGLIAVVSGGPWIHPPNLFRAQTLLPRVIEAQAPLENAVRLPHEAISHVQKERMLKSAVYKSCSVRVWTYVLPHG
jgi:hypothetical protein